ncbi:pyrophosphate--fructose-6-phosphate 1-phosphotransferase [PVC group bacterium (ex Bugula neritina AB1)]|nr:pyrophosphate--fructose-6-phosphate 1-phosphotransferase [PVC group bacterium (ex Bugula neritina AB1)]
MKKIGVLTGGGDCPGLNPVIRGVVRKALKHDIDVLGFRSGWRGLLKNEHKLLDLQAISGILHRGGTILGTSRTNPYHGEQEDVQSNLNAIKQTFESNNLDALVAIGGEDTLGVANKLCQDGFNVVGVPKTIDNDLSATDFTFGFDTSVNIAMEAIDRLHSTAESHSRVIVVEIMGRHAGWITLHAGLAGGADVILIPEQPYDLNEVVGAIKRRYNRKNFSIVAVSEGAIEKSADMVTQDTEIDAFGHVKLGGVGEILAKKIEKQTGFETRHVVLGHIQRGGSPTAFDRVLGLRFGVKAVELILNSDFGKMTSLSGNAIVAVPLADGVGTLKTVDHDLYDLAKNFFD